MTSHKTFRVLLSLSLTLQAIFGGSAGCAKIATQFHDGVGYLACCHSAKPAPVAYVNVGGQVHTPGRVEIHNEQFTLNRALMAAAMTSR